MYFGFYAGQGALQKALIRLYPDILRNTEPSDISILWPALLHIQALSGCSGLPLHVGIVSQRIKDQIPSIEDDVDDHVFVLGIFKLEKESFENRITQKTVDKLSKLLGTPPTWWKISQLLD